MTDPRLAYLAELERKILWLSSWTIHHANHIRPNRDGLKVGGHQASSASMVSIMTALWFRHLRAADRVSVTMKRARPTVNAWAMGPSGSAPGTPAGTADSGSG